MVNIFSKILFIYIVSHPILIISFLHEVWDFEGAIPKLRPMFGKTINLIRVNSTPTKRAAIELFSMLEIEAKSPSFILKS